MDTKEIYIDTEDIENYLFKELAKRGFAAKESELEVVADIMFDYLVTKDVIEEQ